MTNVLATPLVVTDRASLAAARENAAPGEVAVVMTMGALHAGHEALLRQARLRADRVIATIFVNPLQFGPAEDLSRYPRTLDTDLEIAAAAGVDVVFAPDVATMYPGGEPRVRISAGPLGEVLEGAHRPGHFNGVLTVVAKLLLLTNADVAFFGEKDYQQLTLIKAMVRDLDLGTEIVAVPTVREPDGLALSSRNTYLAPAERQQATALSAALRAGALAGERGPDAVLAAAQRVLAGAEVVPDYLALTDPDLGADVRHGPARLLVAAKIGRTRLIDNTPVTLGGIR